MTFFIHSVRAPVPIENLVTPKTVGAVPCLYTKYKTPDWDQKSLYEAQDQNDRS